MNNPPLNTSESLSQVPKDTFLSKIKEKLRFSKRNKLIPSYSPDVPTLSSKNNNSLSLKFLPNQEAVTLAGSSCFNFFILRSKRIRELVPDIEFIKYVKVCFNMISTSHCPEAHFALGRLQAYEGNFDIALQHLKVALAESEDFEYSIWNSVLTLFRVNSRKKALEAQKLFTDLIKQKRESVEVYWGLMNLALRDLLKLGTEIQLPEHFAAKIMKIDYYFGALAWSEIFLRKQVTQAKGEALLRELIAFSGYRAEMYLKLWNFYYYTKQNYEEALQIIQKAFLEETKKPSDCNVVISLSYARSLFKNKKVRQCLELLQLEYTKHSIFTVILYHYGRLCVKSNETVFLGSAIGALEETLKTCSETRHGQIYYWLTFAYLQADEKLESFTCATKSISLLSQKLSEKHCHLPETERRITRKISALQAVVIELKPHKENIENFEIELEENPVNIEECSRLKETISDFDVVEGSICEANMLLKLGKTKKAKKILFSQLHSTRAKMKVYFKLIELFSQTGDKDSMLATSKEMVKKCRSTTVPVQVWVAANIAYAKCLAIGGKLNESLLIYKSLAQVQPIPFVPDLQYTRELQRSYTKEDLENVVMRVNNKQQRYSYLNVSIQDFQLQRSKLVCSREYISLACIDDDEDSEKTSLRSRNTSTERSDSELVGSRAPEPLPKSRISSIPFGDSANIGFSVTTSYTFLYKIGKTCGKNDFKLEEGVLALHDFLNMHHYWGQDGIEIDEEVKVKARYWLGVCLFKLSEFSQAAEIFQDILSMLFQLGRTKMSSDVQRFLKHICNS